jgi:Domain of unknown function (DUF5060)
MQIDFTYIGQGRARLVVAVVFAAALLCGAPAASGAGRGSTSALSHVARYSVFERSLSWSSHATNPWEQVTADVRLTAPSGKVVHIQGFYAGPGVWKFRFAPGELGRWSWHARVSEGSSAHSFQGTFTVVRGSSPGFVRSSPYNRLRWVFDNGSAFYPIGIQDCNGEDDSPIWRFGLDGGGQPGTYVDVNTYLRAYSAAGFDLFRWGDENCSFPLYLSIAPGGNTYSLLNAAGLDRFFTLLRRYGFRIEMTLFGSPPPFADAAGAGDPSKIAAVERYVKYVVDRYGAYVDFWELTNEADASNAWLTAIGGYLHRIDPYSHPLGTSWSVPQLPVMQFGTDHWYQTDDTSQTDTNAWTRLRNEPARALGKPTLVDEQGNSGQNWDPSSALRLRIRSWIAFFAESTLVFWNTSFAKDYRSSTANVYLGPQERGYVRVLQDYTRPFDPRARVVDASVAPTTAARGYALRGPRDYGLYLVAAGDRSAPTTGATATVDPARAGTAVWTDPASGRVLARQSVKAGSQTIAVPPFTVDVALKISS